jgi:hypothetical protein
MKLYTEKQVREVIMSIDTSIYISDSYIDSKIEQLTPIEVPSDEDIEKAYEFLGTWTAKEIMQRSTSFQHGAKWVIEQIKQQENEKDNKVSN